MTVEPELIERYVRDGQVRLVFRSVLSYGERARRASEAAACAGQQGQFWPMRGLIFMRQADLFQLDPAAMPDVLIGYASEIESVDTAAFRACVTSRETLAAIEAADAEQRSRGIISQPIFEIGSTRLYGLQSVEAFARAIEAAQP